MIKFGASGNSDSFYKAGFTSTYDTPKYLHNMGLDAFEYSFGRGTNLTVDKALLFGEEFKKYGIEVSAHAPYYINFANENEEMVNKSIGYILSSLKRIKAFGGKRCVYHTSAAGKMSREEAFSLTVKNTEKMLKAVYENGYGDMVLCPETMGKINQIGTVDEILNICTMDKILIPAFDFGHINAREKGILKTEDDYRRITDKIFMKLGDEKAKNIHIHFSKIQYGNAGEIRHLTMSDEIYGPNFEPLAAVLYENNMTPVVISESDGTQAEDALLMKNIYINAANGNRVEVEQ